MATIVVRRSTTAASVPTTLVHGELAFNIADDPVKGWIGTPGGVKPLFAPPSLEVPIVSPTPPSNPGPNTLWLDSTSGRMFLWYDDEQWVEVTAPGQQGVEGVAGLEGATGATGPTGPEGPTGEVEEAPTDGTAYLRRNGVWIPMTHASSVLSSDVTINAINTWFDGPNVNVGTVGTWLIMGALTVSLGGAAQTVSGRLFDGVTTIADGRMFANAAGWAYTLHLSGLITDPAGPIRLSGRVNVAGASTIQAAPTGVGLERATLITAVRIG